MADLDTAAKRRASKQFLPWMVMPSSDGTIGNSDRVQAAGIYSGIEIQIITALLLVQYTQLHSLTQISKVATLTENTTVEHYNGFTRLGA